MSNDETDEEPEPSKEGAKQSDSEPIDAEFKGKTDITIPTARSEELTAQEQKKQQEMWVLTEDMADTEREMVRI